MDYGDGTGVQRLPLGADKTFTLNHVYADDGTYTVTVTVTDDDGGAGRETFTVTAQNVAPVVVDVGVVPSPVNEGAPALLTMNLADPGSADSHTVLWDFGDGSTHAGSIAGGARTTSIQHTYGDDGTYSVRVTVEDDDGGTDERDLVVEVRNVSPVFDPPLVERTVAEGARVTFDVTASDPSTVDLLSITAMELPAGATLGGSEQAGAVTATFDWKPACDQAGEHLVRVRVTDGATVVDESFMIQVDEACEALIVVTELDGSTVSFIAAGANAIVSTTTLGPRPIQTVFEDLGLGTDRPPAGLFVVGGDPDDNGTGANGVLWRLEGPTVPDRDTMADFGPVASAGVGNDPADVVLSPDGRYAWIGYDIGNQLSIVDTTTHAVVATVPLWMPTGDAKGTMAPVGNAPAAIAFSPDGRYVYVASRQRKNFVVVDAIRAVSDPATAVVASLKIGSPLHALAVAPDGSRVYLATLDDVAVVDTSTPITPVLLGRVITGLEPTALVLTHDGGKLYVVNFKSNSVSVLTAGADLPQVSRTIAVGRRPAAIAITRPGSFVDGDRIYVLNRLDHSVTVIDPESDAVILGFRIRFVPKNARAGIVPTRP